MSIPPGSAASLLPSSLVQSALAAVLRPAQPSPFELLWASHPAWPAAAIGRVDGDDEPATIACLDSSFNPPTTAHEALISAGLPPPRRSSSSSSDSKSKSKPYAGHLLLLSVRNVDKVLKPGDASFEQRLQMIHLLASHLVSTNRCPNIAIGLLSAPAFVNKDRIVREWLRSRSDEATTPLRRLAWLIGTDTLIRFFDQRYYPTAPLPQALDSFFHPLPPNLPSLLIHFPRGGSDGLSSSKKGDLAEAFYAQGLLRDGDPLEWDGVDRGWVSSTVVRERLKALDINDGVGGGEKMALGDLVREGVERFARSEGLYR